MLFLIPIVDGNINSPIDNTFLKITNVEYDKKRNFLQNITVIQLICIKTWRLQGKTMDEQNLDFFSVSHGLIFVDF